MDFAVGNHFSNDVSLHFGNGNGTFQAPVYFSTNPTLKVCLGIVARDLTFDRYPEIVLTGQATDNALVLLNNAVWPAPSPPPGPDVEPAAPTPSDVPTQPPHLPNRTDVFEMAEVTPAARAQRVTPRNLGASIALIGSLVEDPLADIL
jgi:hypothetical protein